MKTNFEDFRDRSDPITGTDMVMPATAVTDPAQAWDEAHVERNIRELPSIMSVVFTNNILRHVQAISPLDIEPLPDIEFTAEQQAKVDQVERLLLRYAITEHIDQLFAHQATSLLNNYGEPKWLYEKREEKLRVMEIRQELVERERRREEDEARRIRTQIPLSAKRSLYFVIDPQVEKAWFHVPDVAGQTRMASGPDAVVEILGGKLTDNDYDQINSQVRASLKIMPHSELQLAIDSYDFAVRQWVREKKRGNSTGDPEALPRFRESLEACANGVMAILRTHGDIALNAIFTSVIRQEGLTEADVETPQPYTVQYL